MWLKVPIDLETEAARVHLLKELERWVALGLLTEGQVVNIGRKLSSPLPIRYKSSAAAEVAHQATKPTPAIPKPIFSGFKSRLVRSFFDELSVLWLLFLGVFLVVVSSGVMAASRWQSFSAVGQYAILLLYTLAFGGASHWAASRSQLQTTAQMLKAATLLLIPLNMWMMDALGVINDAMPLAVISGVGLSTLTLVLSSHRRTGLNLVGLGWLHWGWGLAIWPLAATYIGTVGSAANLFLIGDRNGETEGETRGRSGQILVAVSLLMLLIRSLWIAQVPGYQIGLASGICGWMLCRLRHSLWFRLGAGLMLLGWLASVYQQPIQAIGVSGLALWLLVERLNHLGEERQQLSTLAALWLTGFQACGLAWLVLPIGWRQGLLMAVSQLSNQSVYALNFAGVWLHGYGALMLWGSWQFRRQGKDAWSNLTELLTVGISALLVLFTLPQVESLIFTLSLTGLTATLGTLSWLRRPAMRLVYVTHSAAIATVISGLYVVSEQGWTEAQWSVALIGLVLVEWTASVASRCYPLWRRSAWYFGIVLSAIAYTFLLSSEDSWINLSWLAVPGVLTAMAYRPPFPTERPKQATYLTVLTLIGQGLLVDSWSMATVSLGVGAILMALHSLRWPVHQVLPMLTVGATVGAIHTTAFWLWLLQLSWSEGVGHLYLLMAMLAAVLTIVAQVLAPRRDHPLLRSYGQASQRWSRLLAMVLATVLTVMMVFFYYARFDLQPFSADDRLLVRYGFAALTLLLARCAANRRQINWWALAYGVGLLVTMALSLWHRDVVNSALVVLMARAMVALALLSQLLGSIRAKRCPNSWHYIPLAYGLFGVVLGHFDFTGTTGFYSGLVGIVALALGRRQPHLRPLGCCGLGLFSLGLYELVVYRLLQTKGGAAGDGLTLLALVGSAIALLYLLCQRWIQQWSKLTLADLETAGLLHWLLGVILAILAMVSSQSPQGVWIWLIVTSLLGLHAFLKGNARWFPAYGQKSADPEMSEFQVSDRQTVGPLALQHPRYAQWAWSGLIIATVALPHGLRQLVANLSWLQAWGALIVCGIGLVIYQLPWQRWGWPARPWQRTALSWPMLGILFGLTVVKTQSLLLVGAFYAVMAQRLRAVRLSYLSVVLFNWCLAHYLFNQGWFNLLWLGTLVSMSALYILEVDPRWQPVPLRQERHYLRSLATLLIGLTAMYQAEVAIVPSTALIVVGVSLLLSLGFIVMGLTNQVRAYLYVGTLTFTLQILRTIMMFIRTDGSMLWAVGIILGIALIWVAATFESRRAQVMDLLTHWSTMLQTWD